MATFANRKHPNSQQIIMTTLAHISLCVAAMLDLCAMLRHEAAALQRHGFSNSRYYAWLRQSGELTTPKRLLALAVLIACCTTMARTSWAVILLLAIVLVVQGVMLAFKRGKSEGEKTSNRSWVVVGIAFVLSVLATVCSTYLGNLSSETDALQAASCTAVIMLAISPLTAMLANTLSGGSRKGNSGADKGQIDNT